MPKSSRRRRLKPSIIALVVLTLVTVALCAYALKPAPKVDVSGLPPAPAPTLPTQTPWPVVAFVGDSYTVGSGTSNKINRWSTLTSSSLNWVENNLGRGGTGYYATSDQKGCGLAYCPRYAEMVPEVVSVNPSIVVISGGRNDYKIGTAKVTESVTKTLQDMRAALPKAKIVTLPPFYDYHEQPAGLVEMGRIIKEQTEAVGGTYVDIGQPLLNHPEMVGPDGAHPTDAGYALLAKSITDAIRALDNPALTPIKS